MDERTSPTITLTTPTPSLPTVSKLSSPPPPPPASSGPSNSQFFGYQNATGSSTPNTEQPRSAPTGEKQNYTMNDFNDSPDAGVEGTLDMEVLHDFGEGVGVDMRDFGHVKDDSGEHEMSTPLVQQNPVTPHLSVPSGSMHPVPTVSVDDMFQTETGMDGDDDDDDDEDGNKKRIKFADVPGGFTYIDKDSESGRRKIRIEYINDKSRRHITFSKRKAGIMKKAYELSILTGTQVLLLVVSETGLVYTFTTTKLQPLVQKPEGKNLIQACLNAPDGFGPDGQPLMGSVSATKSKNGGLAIRPHKLTAAASAAMAASAHAASSLAPDQMSPTEPHPPSTIDSIGHGTPIAARPKKRMPSGKGRKATGSGNNSSSEMSNQQSSEIPPVPTIPDMHRQPSPHMGMALQSPMSVSTGYPYPSPHGEYHPNMHQQQQQQQQHQQQQQQQQQQHHHQAPQHHLASGGPSPTQPSFGYPPGEYSYYPPQQQGPPGPQQGGNGYLGIAGQGGLASPYGHAGHPGAHSPGGGPPREADRRMLGMGM